MDALHPIDLAAIQALQGLSPALDWLMLVITSTGSLEFYLLLMPLLYWLVSPRLGMRLFLAVVGVDLLTSCLKVLTLQPRPSWVGEARAIAGAGGYGFPSGHASGAAAGWGTLAAWWRRRWLWVAMLALILLVGLSRVYLGAHYPRDVVAGWLLGLGWLIVAGRAERWLAPWLERRSLPAMIALAFAVSLLVMAAGRLAVRAVAGVPDPAAWASFAEGARETSRFVTLAGALFGAVAGYALHQRAGNGPPTPQSWGAVGGRVAWLPRVAGALVGLVGVVLLWRGLALVFGLAAPDGTPLGDLLRYLRYALIGLWVAYAAPALFRRLGLTSTEDGGPSAEGARPGRA